MSPKGAQQLSHLVFMAAPSISAPLNDKQTLLVP
jgi:hypothetical protein